MQRFKIVVRYNGQAFFGWQRVANLSALDSVQGTLAAAVQRMMPDYHVSIVGSGRTDSGVHASCQVCHVDIIRARRRKDLPPLPHMVSEEVDGEGNAVASSKNSRAPPLPPKKGPLAKAYMPPGLRPQVSLVERRPLGYVSAPAVAMDAEADATVIAECTGRGKGDPGPTAVIAGTGSGKLPDDADPATAKEPMPAARLVLALNDHIKRLLNSDSVLQAIAAEPVSRRFNARHCAYMRRYTYRIHLGTACPFERDRAWCLPASPSALDTQALAMAAEKLVGVHDFTSFRSVSCQADNPVRSLDLIGFHWEPSLAETIAGEPTVFPDDVPYVDSNGRLVEPPTSAGVASNFLTQEAASAGGGADAEAAAAAHGRWSLLSARQRALREAAVADYPRNLARAQAVAAAMGRGPRFGVPATHPAAVAAVAAGKGSGDAGGDVVYLSTDAETGEIIPVTVRDHGAVDDDLFDSLPDEDGENDDDVLASNSADMIPTSAPGKSKGGVRPSLDEGSASATKKSRPAPTSSELLARLSSAIISTSTPLLDGGADTASTTAVSPSFAVPPRLPAHGVPVPASASAPLPLCERPEFPQTARMSGSTGDLIGPPSPAPALLPGRGRVLVVTVMARAFLHSQVRILVGFLMAVAQGKISPHQVQAILDAKDRRANPATTAPPQGLFLSRVYYPPTEEDMVQWLKWK